MTVTMRSVLATVLVSVVGLCGCGGPASVVVEGVAALDGRPLVDAEIQFLPEPGTGEATSVSAYTDAAGRYRIAAVTAGTYRVCINDAAVMMPGGGDAESGIPGKAAAKSAPRPRVPLRYSDATRTPFQPIVVGPNATERNFALTSKP